MRPWCLLTQDIATARKECSHGGQRTAPTDAPRLFRDQARRPGDYWLNIGLVFPHKDDGGFNIMLQAFPLDGKIVCREIVEGEEPTENVTPLRSPQPDRQGGTGRGRR